MSFWVYENWVAESKAVIHAGDCRFCNEGIGTGRNTRGDRNGRWHGPFESVSEAETAAGATGRPVRPDRCVKVTSLLSGNGGALAGTVPVNVHQASKPAGAASELEQFGFVVAGAWQLAQGTKGGVRFSLCAHRDDRVVYAFVASNRVEYIGICDSTGTTLRERMLRYQNLVGAGTNARIVERIKTSLSNGSEVLIYAMRPAAGPSHSNLSVDYVKGLEFPLIEHLNPSWNRRR